MIVMSQSPVFSERLPRFEFSSWAGGADIYFFDNSGICRFSGSLSGGGPTVGDYFSKIPAKEFMPWTQQLRVGGFAAAGDELVIGINRGWPLMLDSSAVPRMRFQPPAAETREDYLELSGDRSLGTIYSKDNSVYFHLYKDSIFSSGAESGERNFLLELNTEGAGGAGTVIAEGLDFPEAEEGWEPVELISNSEGLLCAWKYSDEKKTRFRYLRHNDAGAAVKEIDEDYFRDEYPLIPFSDGPFALRGFIRALREHILDDVLKNTGEVFLELSAADSGAYTGIYPAFFHDENGGRGSGKLPVILPAAGAGDLWYVLSGNAVIRCGENISLCLLPELPDGVRYDRIWADSGRMIVSWEETRFPFIGRSGMMYVNLRDIILE